MEKIPFVDLYAQYVNIKSDIDKAIAETIFHSQFIGGISVSEFEKRFATSLGVQHVVSCANGTDSLEILLKSFKIGIGHEVIVPALSWISTSEAVSSVGAKPVFVDIEEDYFTIDSEKIAKAITSATRAILPVHLYGNPANMPAIMKLATDHNLIVIEDCAQAHEAAIRGQRVGTFGHAASFSFYPGKNLGAYGDAGCMVIKNNEVAAMARMIANHGQVKKHLHVMEGRNSRLDGLQAAILNAKLPYLNIWTEQRIENAEYYNRLLDRTLVTTPKKRDYYKHVFHLYVIRSNKRDALKNFLTANNVETAIHYPLALPFLDCYSYFGYNRADFPVASKYQQEILSLPMFAELSQSQIENVCELIASFN